MDARCDELKTKIIYSFLEDLMSEQVLNSMIGNCAIGFELKE
jgi:hypothetical protein